MRTRAVIDRCGLVAADSGIIAKASAFPFAGSASLPLWRGRFSSGSSLKLVPAPVGAVTSIPPRLVHGSDAARGWHTGPHFFSTVQSCTADTAVTCLRAEPE